MRTYQTTSVQDPEVPAKPTDQILRYFRPPRLRVFPLHQPPASTLHCISERKK